MDCLEPVDFTFTHKLAFELCCRLFPYWNISSSNTIQWCPWISSTVCSTLFLSLPFLCWSLAQSLWPNYLSCYFTAFKMCSSLTNPKSEAQKELSIFIWLPNNPQETITRLFFYLVTTLDLKWWKQIFLAFLFLKPMSGFFFLNWTEEL